MTLYEADGGREETSCLARSSPALLYLGSTVLAGRPAPVRAGQISVVSLGSSVTPARDGDRAFRQVIGRTGRGVRGVVLKLGDGARVTASVSDGWFLAWWPGRSRFAAAEVTAGAGTLQR